MGKDRKHMETILGQAGTGWRRLGPGWSQAGGAWGRGGKDMETVLGQAGGTSGQDGAKLEAP